MVFDTSKISWRFDKPSYLQAETAYGNLPELANSLADGLESLKNNLKLIKESFPDETKFRVEDVLAKLCILPQKLNPSGCLTIPYKHLENDDRMNAIATDFAKEFDEICKILPEDVASDPSVSDSIKTTRQSLLSITKRNNDLKTFIDMQKHIILGFTPSLHKLKSTSSLQGVYWRYWTPQSVSFVWGVEFAERIDFINNNNGSIVFYYGDSEDSTNSLCIDRAKKACTILSDMFKKFETETIESEALIKEALVARAHQPVFFKADDLYDKDRDARYHIIDNIYQEFEKEFNKNYNSKGGNGVKTYFELAYLLYLGVKFTMCGLEKQKYEFDEMIKSLTQAKL